jgi:uncharacterized phage protein (TIGR02220 family)
VVAREAVMADDLGWSVEGFRQAFGEASREGLVEADWKAGVVVLRKALLDGAGDPRETSRPESPNVLKSWAKSWDEVPDCALKGLYLSQLGSFAEALGPTFAQAFQEAFRKALAKASTDPSPNQDQEQKQDQEQEGRVSAAVAASSPAPSARRPPSASRSSLSPADRAAAMAVLRKLGEQTGIEYRGGDKHTRLILGRYHDGFDELDLRKIIAYASRTPKEGGLGWNGDEKMRHCLRPETLFGPENIEKYVDAARSWFKQRIAADLQPSPEFNAWRAEQAPRLAVVK